MNAKHLLLAATVAIGSASLSALAAPAPNQQGRQTAQNALRQYYGPNAKFNIYEERNVNGITVYTAAVDNGTGQSNATVTANGDLLDTGSATRNNELPPAVNQMVQGLFQTPPQTVNSIESHRYTARLDVSGKPYTVDFDATGKILDIATLRDEDGAIIQAQPQANQGQANQPQNQTKKNRQTLQERAQQAARQQLAGNQAQQQSTERTQQQQERQQARAQRQQQQSQQPQAQQPTANDEQQVRQQFAKMFNGQEIVSIHPDVDSPGYYYVAFKNNNGRGFAVMNATGEVPEFRVAIARAELPAPVQTALATLFKADQLRSFERGAERLYRVNESAGNQRIDIWVRQDGDVVAVNEPLQAPQAIPAGARTGPGR